MSLARVVHQALRRAARAPAQRELNLEAIRVALARAEALIVLPPPPLLPRIAAVVLAQVIPFRPRTAPPVPLTPIPPSIPPSAWDPEPPASLARIVQEAARPEPRDEELLLQEINGCKTLLLEIIRRAAYDWVLYRGKTRLDQRDLANTAYRWLFEEEEGTVDWHERMREKKYITSFIAICEGLDLDPDTVRKHIKRLTPKNVMSVGRPAEYRRRDVFADKGSSEESYSLPDGLVDYDSGTDDGSTF